MRNATLLFLLGWAVSLAADADDLSWETKGKPVNICYAVQKNVRFFYNAWANGARDTYGELKSYMRNTLDGKGPAEAKLLAVYEVVLPKIESGELLPPNVATRIVGHQRAQQIAGTACLKAFASD